MNMLTKDQEQRPSAEELLKHPWFSMINSESLAHNKLKKVTKNLEYWSSDATIFQKGMSIYMSNLQSETGLKQLHELRQFFMLIDRNKDGVLTLDELQDAIQTVLENQPPEIIQKLFNQADVDSNGIIEYNEFIAASADKNSLLSDENLIAAFRNLDTNNDGYITKRSLKRAFGIEDKEISDFWRTLTQDLERADNK